MIQIKQTTQNDLPDIQMLWADGDVMKFVGFPEGLNETDAAMLKWYQGISSKRPNANHYCIYDDSRFCGETFYHIDKKNENKAALDIKLYAFARGKGIAFQALSHAIQHAFLNGAETVWVDPVPENSKAIALYKRLGFVERPMPVYLLEKEGNNAIYMELEKR